MRYGIAVNALIFTLVFLAGQSAALSAQEEPTWVLLEQGKRSLRRGDYDDALSAFRQVREQEPSNAEAARYIGIVFEENGDFRQALRYYQRAIDNAPFDIPDTLAEVRYARARIFERRREYGEYEREMGRIFELDEWYSSDENAPQRENQLRVVREDSLSRALVLYRLDPSVYGEPHGDYGAYLVRAGRFAEATPHLVRSAMEIFSHAIEEYRRQDRDYEFSELESFLEDIDEDGDEKGLIQQRDGWRVAYYLATALFFDGYSTRGRELWQFVASHMEAGDWADMAAAQLQRPTPPSLP